MSRVPVGPLAKDPGDTEVDDRKARIAHHDIGGLQIAMDQRRRELLVQLHHPVAQEREPLRRQGERSVALVHLVPQRAPLDVFHDHHQLVAGGMDVVDARQMPETPPGALRSEQVAVGIPHGRINRDALADERPELRRIGPHEVHHFGRLVGHRLQHLIDAIAIIAGKGGEVCGKRVVFHRCHGTKVS